MQVAPADRQHFVAMLQMDVGGFVVAARDVTDRAQVDDDRTMDLGELRGIELRASDAPGFWEGNGSHERGNPWEEQRYSGD